jgi:serine O-acetyltransferase
MELLATICEDFREMAKLRGKPCSGFAVLDTLLIPGMLAVILFRISHFFYIHRIRILSRFFYLLNIVLFSCDIAPPAEIGPGLVIGHPVGIIIGGPSKAGRNLKLFGQCGLGGSARRNIALDGFPECGDNVIIFIGARVFGPIKIGSNAVIAANAVVMRDVPAGGTAIGVPARVRFFPDPLYGQQASALSDTSALPSSVRDASV